MTNEEYEFEVTRTKSVLDGQIKAAKSEYAGAVEWLKICRTLHEAIAVVLEGDFIPGDLLVDRDYIPTDHKGRVAAMWIDLPDNKKMQVMFKLW